MKGTGSFLYFAMEVLPILMSFGCFIFALLTHDWFWLLASIVPLIFWAITQFHDLFVDYIRRAYPKEKEG